MAEPRLPKTLKQLLQLKHVASNEFESVWPPGAMGNANKIAFGGCTIGVGVAAVYQSTPSGFHAYSIVGNFLGPALIDRPYLCAVRRIRDTRSFATRQVEISQTQDNGERRLCMIMLVDLQKAEPAALQTFSASPAQDWPRPELQPSPPEVRESLYKRGFMNDKLYAASAAMFSLASSYLDQRYVQGTPAGDSLYGIVKKVPGPQDGLAIPEKVSADWVRVRHTLDTEAEHVASLAFLMDMASSFISLTHDGKFLDDAGACSSLDFSLRLFSNAVDINTWHLREIKAVNAREGRAYNEARIWDDKKQMVACMTQQAILRPPPPKKEKIVGGGSSRL